MLGQQFILILLLFLMNIFLNHYNMTVTLSKETNWCFLDSFYLFIFYLAVLGLAAWGFLQLWQAGAVLQLWCVGFSLQYHLLLWNTGFRVYRLQQLWFLGSRAQAQQLQHTGLIAPQHVGSSRNQESNPRLLHWQADSLPLSHQGSPKLDFM